MNSDDQKVNWNKSFASIERERLKKGGTQPEGLFYFDGLKATPAGRAYLKKLEKLAERKFPIEPMEHPSKVKL